MKSNLMWNVSLLGILSFTFILFQNCSPNMKFSVHEPAAESSASMSSTTTTSDTPSTPRTPRAPSAPVPPPVSLTIQQKADQICLASNRGGNWMRSDWTSNASDVSNANPCVIQKLNNGDYLVDRCSAAGFNDPGLNYTPYGDVRIVAADTVEEFSYLRSTANMFANVKHLGKLETNVQNLHVNALEIDELQATGFPCVWTNSARIMDLKGYHAEAGSQVPTDAIIYGVPVNQRKASVKYINLDTATHLTNQVILLDVNVDVIRITSPVTKVRLKNSIVKFVCSPNSGIVNEIENAGVETYIKDVNDPRCAAPAN